MSVKKTGMKTCLAAAGLFPALVLADGIVVDKIYHPYVDALEREVEFRSVFADDQPSFATPAQIHRLSFGKSFGDKMFGELYLVGSKSRSNTVAMESYEMELNWQLTEQGEYSADWGMVFEYEEKTRVDVQEISAGLLSEKEMGRWSGTANLFLIREWGDDIVNEYETQLNLQLRYRWTRAIEPGLEFYAGQGTRGMGPVVQGRFDMEGRKTLHWEAGMIYGMDNDSPESVYRLQLEYEF